MEKFHGVYVVMITPFTKNRKIDYSGIKGNIEWWIKNGVHGIIPLGSTGEFASLEDNEKKKIAETVIETVNKRIPVVVGATAETTEKAIYFATQAKDIGADGTIILPPYYFSPNQEEIYNHYKKISEKVIFPLMLYNNPYSSKVDLKAETVIRLSRLKNIDYIKESSGDIKRITELRLHAEQNFKIFCGWEDMVFESFLLGATGWVSVISNISPKQAVELYKLIIEKKEIAKALDLYKKMLPMLKYLEYEGKTQQILKYCLDSIGLCGGLSTTPRIPLSKEEQKTALEYWQKMK